MIVIKIVQLVITNIIYICVGKWEEEGGKYNKKNVKRPLGYERVYLPHYKVADTFISKGMRC